MRRRTCLKTLAAAAGVSSISAAAPPIQLHVDLDVDSAKEKKLVENFRNVFRPAISRQPGFVDVKLLRLRKALSGPTPLPYRLLISFQTEEQRQAWVATTDHQRAWPAIEENLRGSKYTAVLYDAD
ncbi:MAG TPA: antibiotic biosynthesis monooxygenase [Bryobacteraceae bacterium]|nr:antibiotic biosynthesis monooxygenase [Bryobacteraceae bacterium]